MKGSKLKIAVILLLIIFFGLLILFGGFFSRPILEGAAETVTFPSTTNLTPKIAPSSGKISKVFTYPLDKNNKPNKTSVNVKNNDDKVYCIQIYYGIPPGKGGSGTGTFSTNSLPIMYLNHNVPAQYTVSFTNPYEKDGTKNYGAKDGADQRIYITHSSKIAKDFVPGFNNNGNYANCLTSWIYKEYAIQGPDKNKKDLKSFVENKANWSSNDSVIPSVTLLTGNESVSTCSSPAAQSINKDGNGNLSISSKPTFTTLDYNPLLNQKNTFYIDATYGQYGTNNSLVTSNNDTQDSIKSALNLMTFYIKFAA